MIRLFIVLTSFLVSSSGQAIEVDPDPSEYCTSSKMQLGANDATNCVSPAAYLDKTLTRLYLCTSQPDISNLSANCVDSGIKETRLQLNFGDTVELSGSRLPVGTYTHALVIYDPNTAFSGYIQTPVDVTPRPGWGGAGSGTGKYCWGISGFRTDRPGYQSNADCGPVLPDPLPLAQSKVSNEDGGCSWMMGPIVGTRDGDGNFTANSHSADMRWLNARLDNTLSFDYEVCSFFDSSASFWIDKDNLQWKATLFSDFETQLGQAGLLSKAQINQRYLDATEGYKNREWSNANVKVAFSGSSFSIALAESGADITHKMGMWKIKNPAAITSTTKGVGYAINFTNNIYATVACENTACYLNSYGFLTLAINPTPY